MPIAKTAYVDESLRVREGLYVLAAVIVADADADRHRQALRALLYRGQLRLHWRDEGSRRRGDLIAAICGLHHTGAVVIAAGMAPGRQERARRKCIERLLLELASRGIAEVTFERQQSLPAALHASWQPAAGEPLLWLPDIAAGAASLAETGDETYWKELSIAFSSERFWLG